MDTADPAASQSALLAQIKEIQANEVVCDMPIPSPPDGAELNTNKVNVRISIDGDTVDLLNDEDCASSEGWRYDDPDEPSIIELCEDTCELLQSEQDVEINVVFGCDTRLVVI